ncbi:MAG: PAS domain S-box protein [Bacteroidetes bacterium]|jgi:DNA-binding NtrC family response regulator|nr:PAS domain S-box protein [Bacteroidota bacterium]
MEPSVSPPLRIVHLEDVATDAELVARELSAGEVEASIEQVATRAAFVDALDPPPDLVLVDYALPQFDGMAALALVQEQCPQVPVVFVSGAIGEARAIQTLKEGATDYVLKDHLSRLVPAVRRALAEAAEQRARKAAEAALQRAHDQLEQKVAARTAELQETNTALEEEIEERKRIGEALRESEAQLTRVIDAAIDAIINIDAELRITLFNQSAETIFGITAAEVQHRSIVPLLGEELTGRVRAFVQAHATDQDGVARDSTTTDAAAPASSGTGQYLGQEKGLQALRNDGTPFPVEATLSVIALPRRQRFLLILRDVNDRRAAEEELVQLQSEAQYLRQELQTEHAYEEMIGQSPAMQRVFTAIDKVAPTDATVLVMGETGTGKELVARALHRHSPRTDEMLVKVNCAALASDVIESELFGHEKGAFTGAIDQRQGRFELADGGTLFLDEVGELPLETQAKLLRALQEQEFERVGGTETVAVDVRVVAATNRALDAEVDAGRFRSDLYYRLNIFPIEVPPLRAREGDVPLLAAHFCEQFGQRMGKPVEGFTSEAVERLAAYAWPGNVRELANIVERAVILASPEAPIGADQLGLVLPNGAPNGAAKDGMPGGFPTLAEAQRHHIQEALDRTGGVIGGADGAAALLGMKRTTLHARMDRLGVDPEPYR